MLTADPDNAAKQDEQKKRLFEDKNMTHSLIFYLHCYCVCCVWPKGSKLESVSCHHELCIQLVLTNIIAGEN